MKILKFEIKKQISSAVIWAMIIVGVFTGLMIALYPVYYESKDEVLKIIEGFPPQFAAAFGLQLDSIFSFSGFYSFGFSYISLIGGIMASSISIASFSRESRNKCSEFLLTKPISRKSIFVQKLLSGLCLLIATNVIYMIVAMYIGSSNDTDMFLAALSLFLTQLVFFTFGIAYATFAKKVRSVSGMATVFGFVAFILSALVNMLEEESLRFVTPLKYFDPTDVFANGEYDIKYAVTGLIIAIVCVTAAYFSFIKGDIKSV